MIKNGVYIGKDIELVVTDKYVISYRRNTQMDMLESRLFKRSGNDFSCIGICQSSPTETEQYKPPLLWKTAFIYNGNAKGEIQTYQKNQIMSCDTPPTYLKNHDENMKSYLGTAFTIYDYANKIELQFDDNIIYSAAYDEIFDDKTLLPDLPFACDNTIGECLRLWNAGLREEYISIDGISTFIGVTINTNKHMYIFEMTPSSIYCRAARFVAPNKGIVFNQNFRQGFEAYMIKDNSEAQFPLSFDEALFSSNSCAWNDRSVYWSLSSYNENEIVLHGCQGDIYHFNKPKR